MVFYKDTLKILHPLTPDGDKKYKEMLEAEADIILFKHQHPVKYFVQFLKNKLYEYYFV